MNNLYLPPFLQKIEVLGIRVNREFAHLSPAELNRKRNEKSWSAAQNLDHILRSNQPYLRQLLALRAGSKKSTFWERNKVMSRFFGWTLIRATLPQPTRKMGTIPAFEPSQSELGPEVVEQLILQLAELSTLLQELDGLDHRHTMVTSPAGKFVTLRLKDMTRVLVNHTERHLNQASHVLNSK